MTAGPAGVVAASGTGKKAMPHIAFAFLLPVNHPVHQGRRLGAGER